MVIFTQEDAEQDVRICSVNKNLRDPKKPFVREFISLALLGQLA